MAEHSLEKEFLLDDEQVVQKSCPEKIIFCIDLSDELDKTFLLSRDKSYSLRTIWRNCVELFVYNKHLLSPDHQYGVIVLRDAAIWSLNFTEDPEAVCKHMSDVISTGDVYPSFDITSLYSTIVENVKLPDEDCQDPPFIVRTIFLYGRSYSMPIYKANLDAYEKLMRCPHFFFDVFYAHEVPSPKNECQSTFEVLADICPKKTAMVLDVSKNVTRMFDHMSKLLSHPLLRCPQEQQDFSLSSPQQ
jgi:hypothetical protein